jgi:hypothetical protein
MYSGGPPLDTLVCGLFTEPPISLPPVTVEPITSEVALASSAFAPENRAPEAFYRPQERPPRGFATEHCLNREPDRTLDATVEVVRTELLARFSDRMSMEETAECAIAIRNALREDKPPLGFDEGKKLYDRGWNDGLEHCQKLVKALGALAEML